VGLAHAEFADLIAGRRATIDGSRAFQRPVEMRMTWLRRGATVDRRAAWPRSREFNCRSATTIRGGDANRGMNAPATITRSLRDQGIELADLNQEAAELAAKIQQNFEESGA
jgi:hypothetical protein